jgi:mannose-6-phosphate isomerase-like protein (cupin superfamily)
MAAALIITPSETVTVRQTTPELLEVEAVYTPDGAAPVRHLHPAQDESFEVLEGEVTVRTPSGTRTLSVGETVSIPRRTPHQMWNSGGVPARVRWETRPAGRTENWFRDIDAIHRSGRVGRNGMPGLLAYGAILTRYRDVFRLASAPDVLTRPVLALLAVFGRARGY